jgi:hypothetical protein
MQRFRLRRRESTTWQVPVLCQRLKAEGAIGIANGCSAVAIATRRSTGAAIVGIISMTLCRKPLSWAEPISNGRHSLRNPAGIYGVRCDDGAKHRSMLCEQPVGRAQGALGLRRWRHRGVENCWPPRPNLHSHRKSLITRHADDRFLTVDAPLGAACNG